MLLVALDHPRRNRQQGTHGAPAFPELLGGLALADEETYGGVKPQGFLNERSAIGELA